MSAHTLILYQNLDAYQTFSILLDRSIINTTYLFLLQEENNKRANNQECINIEMAIENLFWDLQKKALEDACIWYNHYFKLEEGTVNYNPIREFLTRYNITRLSHLVKLLDDNESFKTDLVNLNTNIHHLLKFSGFYALNQKDTSQLEPIGLSYLFMEEHGVLYTRSEVGGNYIMRCKQSSPMLIEFISKYPILSNMVTNCYWSYFTY